MRRRKPAVKNKNSIAPKIVSGKKQKERNPKQAQKVFYDGIHFQSGLEKTMYVILINNGFVYKRDFHYEVDFAELVESFRCENDIWVHNKGKKTFSLTSKSVRKMIYTPDFIENSDLKKAKWIIETKGNPNESFPLRLKLFKIWLNKYNPTCKMYLPSNKLECEITVKQILNEELYNTD
jgi:hypothetical protein